MYLFTIFFNFSINFSLFSFKPSAVNVPPFVLIASNTPLHSQDHRSGLIPFYLYHHLLYSKTSLLALCDIGIHHSTVDLLPYFLSNFLLPFVSSRVIQLPMANVISSSSNKASASKVSTLLEERTPFLHPITLFRFQMDRFQIPNALQIPLHYMGRNRNI